MAWAGGLGELVDVGSGARTRRLGGDRRDDLAVGTGSTDEIAATIGIVA